MPKSIQPRQNGRASARAGSGVRAAADRSADSPVNRSSGQPIHRSTGLVRSGDRPADVVAFEDAVIGFFIEAADLIGAPKSVAAIYGICFAGPEPLSFSDINERLEISSGSISQGLRVLKEVGALKVAAGSGRPVVRSISGSAKTRQGDESELPIDRSTAEQSLARQREHYEPDLEMRKLLLQWIERRLQIQLNSGSNRLAGILSAVPNHENGDYDIVRERFGSLRTWHDKTKSLLPIAKTFLKLT